MLELREVPHGGWEIREPHPGKGRFEVRCELEDGARGIVAQSHAIILARPR